MPDILTWHWRSESEANCDQSQSTWSVLGFEQRVLRSPPLAAVTHSSSRQVRALLTHGLEHEWHNWGKIHVQ